MRHRERVVVYGLLALLAASVLMPGRGDSTAEARTILADDLGPADALVLRGSKGDLRVRDSGGRLGWGDRPTDRAMSIAAVHVDKLMSRLMASARFVDERTALEEQERAKMKTFEQRREEFLRQYGRISPEHPDFERASEELKAFREAIDQWHTELGEMQEKMFKEQINSAWKDLTSAIDVVSERRGVDLVLRFVPTSESFEAEDPTGGVTQVSSRSILRMPESIDLTPEVMRELNLREE